MLLEQPDLLLLDEPTNHLDIPMIEWLEDTLSSSSLTLLVVTHDRYFLDAVCSGILELDQGKLFSYQGDYANFLEKKNRTAPG
jgi:ATP-binding cassette subfamily F protein uup